MALTNKKVLGIDKPTMTQLAIMPYVWNYNSFWVSDDYRFIYWYPNYTSAGQFWKYDTFTDSWIQLATCPNVGGSSVSYAGDMTICRTRQRIYLIAYNTTAFYYYDIPSNTWSSALTVLPVAPGQGASIKHTCSGRNSAGNDDYIYYFAGDASSRKLYRYSISGNSWTELGTDIIPGAPAGGANLFWLEGLDPNLMFILRGNGTRHAYLYSISENSILGTMEIKGTVNSLSTGSISTYDDNSNELFFVETGSRQLDKVKLNLGAQETGTATSGSATYIENTTKNYKENYWFGAHVTITSGTGAGQTRVIKSNTATRIEVMTNWAVNPDSTSVYEIKFTVLDYGISSATSNTTTLTDSSKAWLTSQYSYCKVKVISGLSAGQERFITSNSATSLTLTASLNLDTTSKYEIIGYKAIPEAQIPYQVSASYCGQTISTFTFSGIKYVYLARKNGNTDWFRYITFSP